MIDINEDETYIGGKYGGEMMPLKNHITSGQVEERPDFGNRQVKSVSEIEIGKKYRVHRENGKTEIIIAISLLNMQNHESYGWICPWEEMLEIREVNYDGKKAPHRLITFAGLGVSIDKYGWSPTVWLEKIENIEIEPYKNPVTELDEGTDWSIEKHQGRTYLVHGEGKEGEEEHTEKLLMHIGKK